MRSTAQVLDNHLSLALPLRPTNTTAFSFLDNWSITKSRSSSVSLSSYSEQSRWSARSTADFPPKSNPTCFIFVAKSATLSDTVVVFVRLRTRSKSDRSVVESLNRGVEVLEVRDGVRKGSKLSGEYALSPVAITPSKSSASMSRLYRAFVLCQPALLWLYIL